MEKEEGLISSSPSESDKSGDYLVPQPASVQGRIIGPTRRSTKGGWTEEEDNILTNAVQTYNAKSWKKIAECLPDRTDVQCLHRWQKVLNPELVKGPWTKEEDDLIIELVQMWGKKKWSEIAKFLPGRIGKQCRERWHNHLNPDIKRTAWTKEEELTLIKAHKIYGNKWAEIAKILHGRTENSIKNHWNCSLRKKLDYILATGSDSYNYQQSTESRNPEVVKQNLEPRVNSELDSGHETATRRETLVKSSSGENYRFLRRGDDVMMSKSSLASNSVGKGAATCLLTTNGNQKTPNNTAMLRESSHNTPANKPSRAVYGSPKTSFSTPLFGKPDDQKRSNNVEATGNLGNKGLGFLCYKPLQLEDLNIFLATGRFPSTDSYIQTASTPILHCPLPSQDRETPLPSNQSSPDTILRSLASQFKNTPSIIRKTKVFDKQDSNNANHRNDVYSEKIMSLLNISPQFQRTHPYSRYAVNGKLQYQKYGTSAVIKSVEKRLEHAFDVEWNAAKAITRNSNLHYPSAANSR